MLLKKQIKENISEPYRWHININSALMDINKPGQTLIINLKPNNTKPNLSLYEIIDIWGDSAFGWTPIMFYLKCIFDDKDPSKINNQNFHIKLSDIIDPVFSMTYLSGTVLNGSIQGKWTAPAPSSTNSVLLWPDTFRYFIEIANNILNKRAY